MGAATVVTLLVVAILVGAVATYLIVIAGTLNRVSFTLGTILIGVRAIEHRTGLLPETLGSIAGEVLAIEETMAGASPQSAVPGRGQHGATARRRSSRSHA